MRNCPSILGWCGLLAVAAVMTPGPAVGQDRTAVARTGARPRLDQVAQGLLDRKADIDVERVTIPVALAELGQKAGVPLVFSDELLPPDTRVTCACREVTVRTALNRILAETSLGFVELARQVIIEPRTSQTDEGLQLTMMSASEPPRRKNAGDIAGTVLDATTEQPLVGVDVRITDFQLAALTNEQGRFLITAAPDGVHQITAARLGYGMQTQEVTVRPGETVTVDFRLEESVIGLDEVVVTTYGQSIRAARTAAVSRINRDILETMPITTADQALQGTISGVQVSFASGQPGGGPEVLVRGEGSLTAGNRPLYIVDGVQMSDYLVETGLSEVGTPNRSILASLNPADIESIEVLKDAAATSIYGAQAANGVVLVTTRRGRDGGTQWSFSSEIGTSKELKTWDVLTGPEWVRMKVEAGGNRAEDLGQPRAAGEQPVLGMYQAIVGFNEIDDAPTFDWPGAIRQTGTIRTFSGSVSGGSATTRFFLSGSYGEEEGQVVKTNFERATLRANVEHQAGGRVSLLANLGLTQTTQNGSVGVDCTNCPLQLSYDMPPIMPIYNDDGTLSNPLLFPYSPAIQAILEDQVNDTRQVVGSFTANVAITSNLNFRSLWGLDYRTLKDISFRPPEMSFIGDVASRTVNGVTNWNTNQVLSYVSSFGAERQHNLSALAGVEYRNETSESLNTSARGFPSSLFRELSDASTPVSSSSGGTEWTLASAFGRVEYDYGDRYLLSASVRRDGSSRFGENHQWGTFYSGSVGWTLSNESFLQDVAWLNDLTVRASYGATGNSSISNTAARTLFTSGTSYAGQSSLNPSGLGNEFLTWEEAETIDLGLEWSAFNGRFYGSVGLFRTDNSGLLLSAFLPSDVGFGNVTRNAGKVRNQGLELELGGMPYRAGEFTWQTAFTLSSYDNEILELVDGLETLGAGTRVGEPLRIHWGSRWAGVNPADGRPMWYDADGNITYTPTADDAQVLGSPLPDYEGGWTNTLSYGPVSLSGHFTYSLGADVEPAGKSGFMNPSGTGGNVIREWLDRRWQQPGDMTDVPKAYSEGSYPGTSSWTGFSDRWLDDGSYIRLRTVRLHVDLPETLASRIGGVSGSVYAAAYNLWTYTKFGGLDPEVENRGSTWPGTRQLRFGIQLRR